MEAEIQAQIPNIDHVLSEYSVVSRCLLHRLGNTVEHCLIYHSALLYPPSALWSVVSLTNLRDISTMLQSYISLKTILQSSLPWLKLLTP